MNSQMLSSRLGAELTSFKVDGIEKIHQGPECTDNNGRIYWKRQFNVLFPIVGKLKKNQTMINGKTYELPEYGFAKDLTFEPISKLDNFHSYVLKSTNGTLYKFPYKFSLTVTYRSDKNKLTTIYKVVNDDTNDIFFQIGSRPGFALDKEKLDNNEYYIEFEEEESKLHFLFLVDGLVGTEYGKDILVDKKKVFIDNHTFDNGPMIMQGITSKKLYLKTKSDNKTVLILDFDGFSYVGLWSKPGAPFIAIEPLCCTSDTVNSKGIFKEKSDILKLSPKEEFECKYTVEFFN